MNYFKQKKLTGVHIYLYVKQKEKHALNRKKKITDETLSFKYGAITTISHAMITALLTKTVLLFLILLYSYLTIHIWQLYTFTLRKDSFTGMRIVTLYHLLPLTILFHTQPYIHFTTHMVSLD